jgi:aminoglycoside phosphotransferase (APT) family kinase protein
MARDLPPPGLSAPPPDAPPGSALALVPGLEQGARPLAVQRLAGGSVNHVWRVDTPLGRFVLRTDAAASRRPGVDRERERRLHTLAAAADIAPPILARTPAGDAQVTPYIDARHWQVADYADVAQLQRLGALLARLHAIETPADLPAFAPAALASDYARAGNAGASGECTAHARQLCAAVIAAEPQLQVPGRALRLVHGDPTEGNVLDGRRLWLIDWEYAQCADPLFDVAAVLAYYPAARPFRLELLAAAGLASRARNGHLAAAIRIHMALEWLWRHARGESPAISAGNSGCEWAN